MNSGEIPPPAVLQQLVENQTKDLEIRASDQELRKQSQQQQFEWAMASLDAQKVDRESERKYRKDFFSILARCGMTIVIVIAIVFAIALFLNKEAVALEIVKMVGTAIVSFIGGYGFGKGKTNTDGSSTQTSGESSS